MSTIPGNSKCGADALSRSSGMISGIRASLVPVSYDRYEILDTRWCGRVSYHLALPPQLSHVHNVFHVSLLRGYKYHPLHVVSYPFDQIREDLSYTEEPESITRPQTES
ncbi:hypothetical protein Tco_0748605 [Tanacetum coccineum]|uniref:Tf2-1-like SH3-like domain-containing protein n=1 Tax=Tanacetum coccineum TaxID=301880 RepID=A0ABQ4YW44_9ASTR